MQVILSINKCRKFLRATTISDITNGYGTHITNAAYECQYPLHCTSSLAYNWPKQAKPGINDIAHWKNFLDHLCHRGRKLIKNIGSWTNQAALHHQWRYQPEHDCIYEQSADGWKIWTIRPTRNATRRKTYQLSHLIAPESETLNSSIPVVYKTSMRDKYIRHNSYDRIKTESVDPPITLLEELKSYGWVVPEVKIHDEEKIKFLIEFGNAKGATDGSSKNGKSTSGFLLFDDDDEDLLEGGNYVPGNPKDQNSYRSELGGLLGLVLSIHVICKQSGITNGSITVGCDNDAALEKMFDDDDIPCTTPSYDLIRLIRYYKRMTHITWRKQKVTGHQDKEATYESLDEWGKANVRADSMAKHFMDRHPESISNIDPKGRGWMVHIGGEPIISDLSRRLYTHCTGKAIKRYWAEKNYIDLDVYDDDRIDQEIHWDAVGKFSKMIPNFKR